MGPAARETVKRRFLLLLSLFLILVLYLLVGGVVMYTLEHDNEVKALGRAAEEMAVLRSGKAVLDDYHIKQLEDDGICSFPKNDSMPHWTFTGATFYSMTVITTIGFGSFAPGTWNGRSFTAVYAIVGISIFGQLMAELADVLAAWVRALLGRAGVGSPAVAAADDKQDLPDPSRSPEAWAVCYGNLREKYGDAAAAFPAFIADCLGNSAPDEVVIEHCLNVADPSNSGLLGQAEFLRAMVEWFRVERDMPHTISLRWFVNAVGWCLVWCLGWAGAFSALEGWTYRESLWFCMIAMTTIGFGDFTPEHTGGRVACFFFVLPGISLTAGCFGAVWATVRMKRFWLLQRLYDDGTVSEKALEAFGISVALRKRSNGAHALLPADRSLAFKGTRSSGAGPAAASAGAAALRIQLPEPPSGRVITTAPPHLSFQGQPPAAVCVTSPSSSPARAPLSSPSAEHILSHRAPPSPSAGDVQPQRGMSNLSEQVLRCTGPTARVPQSISPSQRGQPVAGARVLRRPAPSAGSPQHHTPPRHSGGTPPSRGRPLNPPAPRAPAEASPPQQAASSDSDEECLLTMNSLGSRLSHRTGGRSPRPFAAATRGSQGERTAEESGSLQGQWWSNRLASSSDLGASGRRPQQQLSASYSRSGRPAPPSPPPGRHRPWQAARAGSAAPPAPALAGASEEAPGSRQRQSFTGTAAADSASQRDLVELQALTEGLITGNAPGRRPDEGDI
eukprot:TRINITY_DN15005_c0_g1_i1.p1 TRINITY_DN15005_c0_g1~~TRINITY_DN15005_c0_g1_i1.p1  ORF type:complete len:760 (+),score=175.88 TRINITY_DN15005_c0_g1_i1:87-2282(+)